MVESVSIRLARRAKLLCACLPAEAGSKSFLDTEDAEKVTEVTELECATISVSSVKSSVSSVSLKKKQELHFGHREA